MNIESNLQQQAERPRELTYPLGEGVSVPEHLRHLAQTDSDRVAINFYAAKAAELVGSVS
jgi:hypothetical protein